MTRLYLSPSKIATYENCPREFLLKYILKVTTEEEGAALGFGSAVMGGFEAFARALVAGKACDPVAVFDAAWSRFIKSKIVRYNTIDTEDGLRETGRELMRKLPAAWKATGYTIALDAQGEPIVERNLEIDLGDGIVLRLKLDLAVYNASGELGIDDLKTTKSASSTNFALLADQLTAYQLAVLVHKESLGIDAVDFVAFWEFLKRNIPKKTGKGPEIIAPEEVPARSEQSMQDYVDKAHWVAQGIRAGRFPRTPRMAFNSPCGMCDYANYCARGDTDDLIFRDPGDIHKGLVGHA